ncbi:MAG: HDOD domain-containing protein [Gemmatimonadota bacterium]
MSVKTYSAQDFVSGAGRVASPPLIYERLTEVIHHPRSGAADIATVISEDQGLTARLLRVVNSAFFSLPWRVDTVTAAVRVVGTQQIRDLAVATAVVRLFDDVPSELIHMDSFWHHSLACGVTARVLATHRGEENIERFFVAGLLHDVGRLLMFTNAGSEMAEAMQISAESRAPLYTVEREVLGLDHARVGGALMEEWNFPPALLEAVRFHHDPLRASRFPAEVSAIHVSDIVAHALAWGKSGEPYVPPLKPPAWECLALDPALIPMVLEDAERQLDAAFHLITGRGD